MTSTFVETSRLSQLEVTQKYLLDFLKLEFTPIYIYAPICLEMIMTRGGCVPLEDQMFRVLPRQAVKERVLVFPGGSHSLTSVLNSTLKPPKCKHLWMN